MSWHPFLVVLSPKMSRPTSVAEKQVARTKLFRDEMFTRLGFEPYIGNRTQRPFFSHSCAPQPRRMPKFEPQRPSSYSLSDISKSPHESPCVYDMSRLIQIPDGCRISLESQVPTSPLGQVPSCPPLCRSAAGTTT